MTSVRAGEQLSINFNMTSTNLSSDLAQAIALIYLNHDDECEEDCPTASASLVAGSISNGTWKANIIVPLKIKSGSYTPFVFFPKLKGTPGNISTGSTKVYVTGPDPVATPTPSSSPSPKPKVSPGTPTIEDDGAEEDQYADLDVLKRSDGKYKLDIISNIAEEQLVITAMKKGFKSITYRVTTNEFGSASIITTRKLAGFTLTVRYSGDFLTSIRVR
jgi:hypothetical protein